MSKPTKPEQAKPVPVILDEQSTMDDEGETLVYAGDPLGGEGGFDYSQFEAQMSEMEGEEAKVATEEAPVEVGAFRTLPRVAYKQNVQTSIRPAGRFTAVSFRGRINETFDAASLAAQVSGPVIFDLAQVDRVTSFGVRGWLELMQKASFTELYLIRCSEHVVNQITMIRNFCGIGRIHSVLAPYRCEACGAEFNIVLDALQHRDLFVGRAAPTAACPDCQEATELDEDAWEYLALDDQLIDDPPPESLPQSIQLLLEEGEQVPPIEKFFDGSATRLRFNKPITTKSRFKRAFSGLEGDVILEFAPEATIEDDGIEHLLNQLQSALPDVKTVFLEAAPFTVCQHVLDEQIHGQVRARSVLVEGTNKSGVRRTAHIDLERNRIAIEALGQPKGEANWSASGIHVDQPEELRNILRQMGPVSQAAAAPAAAPQPSPSAVTAVTAQGHIPLTPVPAERTLPPPVAAAPAPAQTAGMDATTIGILGMMMFMAFTIVAIAVVLLVFLLNQDRQPVAQAAPQAAITQPVEAPKPAPVVASKDTWTTEEPPAWATEPTQIGDDQIAFVGQGVGADEAQASAQAQDAAQNLLANLIVDRLKKSGKGPQSAGLVPPSEGLWQSIEQHGIGVPKLVETKEASRTRDGKTELVAQFTTQPQVLDDLLAYYTNASDLMGIKVVNNAPWAGGVRVVSTPTYFNVPKGALLVAVDGQTASSAAEAASLGTSKYQELPPGGSFKVTFRKDGESYSAPFSKRAAQPTKVRPKPNKKAPTLWKMQK